MKSKTKISKQVQRKTNSKLVEAVILAKKHPGWLKVAAILSSPRKNAVEINLGKINDVVKDGETIVVPGKVLSQGELTKKVKIVALKFSEASKEKLLKSKISTTSIGDEIKANPSAKGIKVFTGAENENN